MNFAEAFTVCGILMFISFLISSFKKQNKEEFEYEERMVKLKIENMRLLTIIEERRHSVSKVDDAKT